MNGPGTATVHFLQQEDPLDPARHPGTTRLAH